MINNLLFDLGGVIMDIRKEDCVTAFEKLGLPDAAAYFGDFVQQEPFASLESGHLSVREFHDILRPRFPQPVTNAQIDNAFQQFLKGIPVERLQQLRSLRKRFNLYLLSNTNPIMWKNRIAMEFGKEGLNVHDYFDGITTSFAAKAMKPAPEIFEYAAATMEIVPDQTLFLDDSEANCRAAEALGWKAAHVPVGTSFMNVIDNYLTEHK